MGLVELEQTIAITVVLSGPVIYLLYLRHKRQLTRAFFLDYCKKFIPLYIAISVFLYIALTK
ncbi:MAG: hypothetical protein FGM18_01155 [Burkholderiaceae bacterium]|nr:hypothetical protein [Burkholderiaceae bacterium]